MRAAAKWCFARLGDVTCQLRYGHPGSHRAETGAPVKVGDDLIAQVLTWND